MARHRATRSSIASAISTTSTNGTRSRARLSYEQSTLLALAENSLKKRKKPLNISAIVKDAERRAHEQGLSLGIQARTRIKKAVEQLGEHGAVAEAPRKGRAPAQYSLTPKAAKVYNDAKSHRRSEVGIAKEMTDTLKGDDRPAKRRRSSVSVAAISSSRSTQATIEKLKADLAVARSEIKSLKQSNQDLLDQQLEDDDDYDAFGSPTRKALSSQRVESERPVRPFLSPRNISFGNRPTRPTTPEPTEHGSPEYEAPGDFSFMGEVDREMTPPSSSPDAIGSFAARDDQTVPPKSEIELKLERLEASMAELTLERAQMAEEIVALKNQVQHERESVARLAQEKHEADLVQVELAQVSKDRDLARKEVSRLEQTNAELKARCASITLSKEQLDATTSQLRADIRTEVNAQSEIRNTLVETAQELESTQLSLSASQDEAQRLTESLAMTKATTAVLNANLSARDSTISELESARTLSAGQLQTLRSEVQTLRDNLSIAEGRVSAAEAATVQRNSQIAGLKAEQEALQATVTGLQVQKSGLASENATLATQIEESNAVAQDLRAQITHLSDEIEGLHVQVSELQLSLDAVQSEKDRLQVKVEADSSKASRTISERDTKIKELNRIIGEKESDLKSRARHLSERQEQITRLNLALAESTTKIASLDNANKSISDELSTSIAEVKALNNRVADLRKKEQNHLTRIEELDTSLAQYKDSLEEHQDLISKLELQLDRLKSIELESLRKRRARFEAEAKRLRDEEAELTQETIDVDQWDESLSQSRIARPSLAPSFKMFSSP